MIYDLHHQNIHRFCFSMLIKSEMLNKYTEESAKHLSLSDNSIPKSVDVTP